MAQVLIRILDLFFWVIFLRIRIRIPRDEIHHQHLLTVLGSEYVWGPTFSVRIVASRKSKIRFLV